MYRARLRSAQNGVSTLSRFPNVSLPIMEGHGDSDQHVEFTAQGHVEILRGARSNAVPTVQLPNSFDALYTHVD